MDLTWALALAPEWGAAIGKWLRDTASIGAVASVSYAGVNWLIAKWRERPLVVQRFEARTAGPESDRLIWTVRVRIFNRAAQPIIFRGLEIIGNGRGHFAATYEGMLIEKQIRYFRKAVKAAPTRLVRTVVIDPFVPGASQFPSTELRVEIEGTREDQRSLRLRVHLEAMPSSLLVRSQSIVIPLVRTT